MRRVICAVAILAAGLLTSCGAVGPRPAATSSPGASPVIDPTTAAGLPSPGVPLHTPPTNAQGVMVITDQDNGHSISLRAGRRLELQLASTYWQVDGSSNSSVLRLTAGTSVSVSPQIRGCVPGEGCGTVTALFDAVAPGTADVSARRTSCGEAMSCTGNLGFYRVTVVVTT
jgi:hypothetical protein